MVDPSILEIIPKVQGMYLRDARCIQKGEGAESRFKWSLNTSSALPWSG